MAIFIETIVARSDGRIVTTRQQVRDRSWEVANRLAWVWACGFDEVDVGCFCADCAPVLINDLGEKVTVQVNEYSPEARVKEGLEII